METYVLLILDGKLPDIAEEQSENVANESFA